MLDHKSELVGIETTLTNNEISIALNDGPLFNAYLILPSIDELKEIEARKKSKFSIAEVDKFDLFNDKDLFLNELDSLKNKYERFSESVTYLNKLASLSFLAGELEQSIDHLNKARSLDDNAFYKHELGNVFLELKEATKSRDIFSTCDLDKDIYANLKLAYFQATDNKIDKAKEYVEKALSIDNTDYSARMFAGAINLWDGEWEKAIRSFRVAIESNSKSSPLLMNLAVAYWGLGNEEKAVQSLRRSISLDPLNKSALTLYSDIMFYLGNPEKIIKPYEFYLKYEQKDSDTWTRLARAYYETGLISKDKNQLLRKSLDVLKHEASLKESTSVWNNIGVVYDELGALTDAHKFYSKAIKSAQDSDFELPLSNLLGVLIGLQKYDTAHEITSKYLETNLSPFDNAFSSKIVLQHVICLEGLNKRKEALNFIKLNIDKNISDINIKVDMMIHLTHHLTVVEPNESEIKKYLNIAIADLEKGEEISPRLKSKALNNIAFTMLQFNKIEEAEELICRLSNYIHKDPFATATLGLLHLKKGRLEKSTELYKEAISIANGRSLKDRIRQRMNFELGKYFICAKDFKQAVKYLQKAKSQKLGYSHVAKQIDSELKKLH